MNQPTRREFHRAGLVGAASVWASAGLTRAAGVPRSAGAVDDFSFVHVSDTHLDPRPAGADHNPDGRSVRALAWFARQTRQAIGPNARLQSEPDVEAAPPAFAIHTGDVFEYSVIDDCWGDWLRIAAALACPVYCVPGNHDNAWSSINAELRQLYGGDSYSFDHGGCHFACLNSAGSLDPLPCWDERTLRWLAADLQQVDPSTPVLLAFHHPLSGNAGYASEFDKLRFWEVVRRHRVALMMDGHWHQVRAGVWQNIPRVNGGETFRLNTGYAAVRVAGGVLTQRYHFHETAEGGARDALVLRQRIDRPAPRYACEITATWDAVAERLALSGPIAAVGLPDDAGAPQATAWIDGDRNRAAPLQVTAADVAADAGGGASRFLLEGTVAASDLAPGRHFATVRMESPTAVVSLESDVGPPPSPVANEQGVAFDLPDPTGHFAATQFANNAGIKSPLLLLSGAGGQTLLAFGDTAGAVTALDAATMRPVWRYETGSEILHSVTRVGDRLAVGDSDGALHLLDARTGRRLTRTAGFGPLFGAGVVAAGSLYLGDANGRVHCVAVADGSRTWSKKIAQYGFESAPAYDAVRDRLVLGAWDGRYYAVECSTGEVAWQAINAFGQQGSQSRYYGPADCSPVIVGDEVWGADRGYCLGRFAAADGAYLGQLDGKVAAIGAIVDGDSLAGVAARGLDDRLIRFALDGSVVWEVAAPAGRTPLPPTSLVDGASGQIAVASDQGVLTVVDAATGSVALRWSTAPGLYVLAPLTADADSGAWYAAAMDGVATRIARAS